MVLEGGGGGDFDAESRGCVRGVWSRFGWSPRVSSSILRAERTRISPIVAFAAASRRAAAFAAARAFRLGRAVAVAGPDPAAVADDPEHPDGQVALAFNLTGQGHYEEARRANRVVLRVRPSLSFPFRSLGSIEYYAGNHSAAVNYSAESLRLWPEDGASMLFLGRTFTVLGEHELAGQWFDRMRDHLPPQLKPLAVKLKTEYDMQHHNQDVGSHMALIDDKFVDWFTIAGPPNKCIDRLGSLIEKGLDHVYILGGSDVAHPHGERVTASVKQTEHFAKDVMPQFR